MNGSHDMAKLDKDQLVARCALIRLRLRSDNLAVRESLFWGRPRNPIAPSVGQLAFGIAVSVLGATRMSRFVMLSGRIVLFANIARTVISFLRPSAYAERVIDHGQPGAGEFVHSKRRSP